LSRAGWISVTVQVLLGGWLLMPYLKSFLQKAGAYLLWGGAVVGMVIGVYMIFFLRSSVVSSSDTARFTTTEIVWFYAKRSPLWGYGPGMYIPIFESTQDYVQEFGEALESHGFMQKILLEEGMVGLILFLSILLYVLWRLWRVIHQSTNTVLSRMFLVMVVGAMIFQLFNTSYFISVMWMPIGVALAHSKLFYKEV
jgi:O-antigen ligase